MDVFIVSCIVYIYNCEPNGHEWEKPCVFLKWPTIQQLTIGWTTFWMNNIVDECRAHSSSFGMCHHSAINISAYSVTRRFCKHVFFISYPKMIFGNELLSWHHKGHFLWCAATADRLGGTLCSNNLTSGRKISGVSPLILASAIANSISQQ